eukprot:TRINITY_DN36570_c0_g5_i1.p1 TRINITY_DN36570_c0_g5~~TRINITY_DN36570_c0_g5_i1.p1  ORF type:complete len:1376 (+),score=284.18 TRINITY_DN36570_c0_g5_i1:53-4180(+)
MAALGFACVPERFFVDCGPADTDQSDVIAALHKDADGLGEVLKHLRQNLSLLEDRLIPGVETIREERSIRHNASAGPKAAEDPLPSLALSVLPKKEEPVHANGGLHAVVPIPSSDLPVAREPSKGIAAEVPDTKTAGMVRFDLIVSDVSPRTTGEKDDFESGAHKNGQDTQYSNSSAAYSSVSAVSKKKHARSANKRSSQRIVATESGTYDDFVLMMPSDDSEEDLFKNPESRVSRSSTRISDFSLPPPLRDRWQLANGKKNADMYKTGSVRPGQAPKLDDRWRELFISNETEAESDQSVAKINAALEYLRTTLSITQRYSTCDSLASAACAEVPFHPYHQIKLGWDFMGLFLVMFDVITIPISTAWQFSGDVDRVVMVFNALFWTIDMIVAFNTGFFMDGSLVFSRRRVTLNYLQSWFLFDAIIISLDVAILAAGDSDYALLRGVRALRILRLVRGLRLLKMRKLSQAMEELFTCHGQAHLILILSILKIFVSIFVFAHTLACLWFWIGRESHESGKKGWLDSKAVEAWKMDGSDDILDQYLQSMSFILGILVANTTDCLIGPENIPERFFIVLVILCSLMVLGSAVGKMTNTINELDRLNSEVATTKVVLQRYLRASDVPMDLSSRIIRFAVHSLRRRLSSSLSDSVMSLFSERLSSELLVSQRSKYIFIHPLFNVLNTAFPEALLQICRAFNSRMFADGESAFVMETWAEKMYFTTHGSWELQCMATMENVSTYLKTTSWMPSLEAAKSKYGGDAADTKVCFSERRWFAELSLYVRMTHRSSLTAVTFADAYTLTGKDLATSVSNFPGAIGLVYRYAEYFLSNLLDSDMDTVGSSSIGREVVHDFVPEQRSHKALQQLLTKRVSAVMATQMSCRSAMEKLPWLQAVFRKELPLHMIKDEVENIFFELNPIEGTYSHFGEKEEQRRSVAAVLCFIMMHYGDYEAFTECQPAPLRMTPSLWDELMELYDWFAIDELTFNAVLVLLAIRGLGKSAILAKTMPPEQRSPEEVIISLMLHRPHMVASIFTLDAEQQSLIRDTLAIHGQFNLAQLLQAENTPHELGLVQSLLQEYGYDVLKFYIACLLSIMCAVRGVESTDGSVFMDESNATTVILGINCLRAIKKRDADPRALYWCFIGKRAECLGLSVDNFEELVIARICCLTRSKTAEVPGLLQCWRSLTFVQRSILTAHFLADGIEEVAYLFSYLPLLLVNAKRNPCVRLRRCLLLLVDLIELLREDGVGTTMQITSIVIDVQDVANFAKDVKNTRMFDLLGGQVSFVAQGSTLKAQISTKHWHRVDLSSYSNDPSVDRDMAFFMRQTLRAANYHERTLEVVRDKLDKIESQTEALDGNMVMASRLSLESSKSGRIHRQSDGTA